MRLPALPLLLCAFALHAADVDPAVDAYQKADDVYAKRKAVKGLGGSQADEATLLPLLKQALADRATAEIAMDAIRQRFAGGAKFPIGNDTAQWNTWLAERQKEVDAKKRLEQVENKNKPAPAAAATAPDAGAAETPADPAAGTAAVPAIPTDELGKIDRIIYKSGSSLRAYVRSRRVDADNNLVSVRVVHPDGRGEEVIEAKVIARIEEDVE